MIPAIRQAQTPAGRALEMIRSVLLLLSLAGWLVYPVELVLLKHWLKTWHSKVPFVLSPPAAILTAWVLFLDRGTPWARRAFIVVMWAAILMGLAGAYFHLGWNFEGKVNWGFATTMKAAAGERPVLAPLAFVHLGVTGLLAIYRAR
ncbi:MAG: hypothetical protein HY660_11300 [Armatimonadetes bacterium]|nr:hypothetical protein [Armatimonadota bacterium]